MQNASLSPVMAAAPLTRTSTSSSDWTSLSTRSAASNDSSTTLVGALEIKGCPTPPLKVLDVCHDCAAVLPPVDHRLDPHPVNRRLGTKIPLNALADALTCSLSASLTSMDRAPCLRVILATNDAGCKTYLAQLHKVCSSLGVALDPVDLRNRHDQFRAIRKTIWSANRDDSVDGLLVLFPIFAPTYPEKVRVYSSPSRGALRLTATNRCRMTLCELSSIPGSMPRGLTRRISRRRTPERPLSA
jgi:hypothetical protein